MLQFSLANCVELSSVCIIQGFPVFTAVCQCFDSEFWHRQWLRLWLTTCCRRLAVKRLCFMHVFPTFEQS